MNDALHINGKKITTASLSDKTWEDTGITPFLSEWFSDQSQITVQTSGSTGTPKPIELSKSDMVASAQLTGQYFKLKPGDSALLCLPSKYIAGKMMLVRSIILQLDLMAVLPSSNPIKNLERNIDFAAMTPMQVKTILNETPEKLNLIKTLIIGGAPVDHILEEQLQSFSARCYSTYGMTETITHIAVKQLNGPNRNEYFEALPSVQFKASDDQCLIIYAPHLSTSTFTTNDIAEISGLENFKWKGRKDNIINSGGIKLQPEAIETKLCSALPNHRFFIDSVPDSFLGQKVVLIIESEKSIYDIQSKIATCLSGVEQPKEIHYLPQFIETETGKIQRRKTLDLI